MSDFVFDLYETPAAAVAEEEGLALNTEHAAQAIGHLIEYFRRGPRNQAVLSAIAEQVQDLEQAFWDLYRQSFLANAVGTQLDQIGEIVGEARNDRTDAQYRAAIRIRVLVLKSRGRLEDLIEIAARFVSDDSGAVIIASELYPAGLRMEIQAIFSGLQTDLGRLLRKAKSGGVRLDVVTVDRANAFIWGQRGDAGLTTPKAYGNRGQTTGGLLASAR
jgi:hypothetical protein